MSDSDHPAEHAKPAQPWFFGDASVFFQKVFRSFSRHAMPTLGAATLVALIIARARRPGHDARTRNPK